MDAVADPLRFRDVFGRFATGVAVITSAHGEMTGGMTANAVCSLSLDPMLVLVCFENAARTLPLVREAGAFAVNVLAAHQQPLARVFASKRPEGEKLDGVPHEYRGGLPVLTEALAWVTCELRDDHPGGDHTIVIGEVTDLGTRDGEPLVWYGGTFRGLGG